MGFWELHTLRLFGGDHRIGQRTTGEHADEETNPLDATSLLVASHSDVKGSVSVSLLVQDCSGVIQDSCNNRKIKSQRQK